MTLRAVLVGCGAMSKGWLDAVRQTPSLRDGIEIVGLVDLDLGAARRRAEDYGIDEAIASADLETTLQQAKPDIVFDVVIPSARFEVVTTGLRHGAHVLSEKPMAISLADARALIEASQRASRIHAIVQNRRFNAGVRRIRSALASGLLGRLNAVHCDFFIGAHFGGFREQMHNVLLLDMAIHTFDAARFMAGKQPLSVYCHESNPHGSWYAHGSVANAIFELSDDVVFTYRGSWSAEGANTNWDASWRIVGSRGTILWDGDQTLEAKVVIGDSGFIREVAAIEVPDVPGDVTHGHASALMDFVDAIQSGRQPETVSHDNIKSLEMVFAAIESSQSGRRVQV